ncbi:TetR/AcrR family transcriptional regulator C-terminal domain-containing protein [Kitasatospora sp. NPDC056138]|uniref:TetR/AcrR family transcriptional regulator C-terminal domain-containing protein n=1 Tax=Kitasatospora sp. NPDC056138 TaxID=3345724 RepID=UPI0035DC8542
MDRQDVPRYSQIVAELRQRIETGELAPGDRVPSTREITRRWGVAMATATRVLTELRHAGLVRAVPGIGTVVDVEGRAAQTDAAAGPADGGAGARPTAARSRRKGAPEQALASERIVVAAIAVADEEGLAAVSMRRVAAELGAATMSLYRHVSDKDDLLLQMMDTAFSEWPLPADPPEGWRERLELAARQLWAMFRRHPWLAPALSVTRPQPIASALPYTEWVLACLVGCGLDLSTAFTAHLTLFNHIRGTAINAELETEAEALSGLDSEEWLDSQEPALDAILTTGSLPTLERLSTAGYDFDLDELFEFGLRCTLDGIAALLERRR